MIIRELAAIFTFKYDQSKLQQATTALDVFASKANLLMGAIAGHYAVQALTDTVSNIANALEQVGKSSANLGITAQALQELRFAAEKSGLSVDNLEDCLKELMLRSVDAKSGTGDAAEGFLALGIATTDAAGRMREPLALLDEVADKVKNMPTVSDKIWATDKLFGDPGFFMLGLLNKGSAGIRELRKEAQSLGVVLEQDSIKKAVEFNIALKAMKASTGGVANSLTSALLPAFTSIIELITNLSSWLAQINTKADLLRLVFPALGIAIAAFGLKSMAIFTGLQLSFVAMIATVASISALFVALALILDDLWVAFEGGDSIFKSLYESAVAFFKPLKEWIANLSSSITNLFSFIPNIIPDYFKKGLVSTMNFSGNSQPEESMSFVPAASSLTKHTSNTNNQSVNVAVNVKSGANPQEIGSEVSKAVRRELDRERSNAFMGVTQYAS